MGSYHLYTVERYEVLADGTYEVVIRRQYQYNTARNFDLERYTFELRRGQPVNVVRYVLNKKPVMWMLCTYTWDSWTPMLIMPCLLEIVALENAGGKLLRSS